MIKKIIILLFILTISINANSQNIINTEIIGENKPYTEIFDSIFKNIRYDTLSTKILYDKVIPFVNLEKQNGFNNDTLDKNDYIQAYSELHRASSSELKTFSESIESLRDNIFLNSNDSLVQIGVILSDYSIIDTNAFNDHRLKLIDSIVYVNDTNTRNIFINKKAFISSPLTLAIYNKLLISFNINNLFVFNNTTENINKILVDYNNGNGYYSYNINGEISILENIYYQTYGEKYISIKIITTNQDTLACISKISLHEKTQPFLNVSKEITILADRQFEDVVGKGVFKIYYSKSDKKLRKPILIVDGFDPSDTRRFDYDAAEKDEGGIWGLLKYDYNGIPIHLGEELIRKGYDIVILNFPTYIGRDIDGHIQRVIHGGADDIQRNATVCEKVIDTLNYMLKNNNSQEQLIVIGPSMGGQITRYALKTMENNNLNYDYRGHNTRLWVSFDSPHQGAYIPLSVQNFLHFFGYECGKEFAKDKYIANFRSVAARQMLTNQIESSISLFSNYYNEINQLGFPNCLRKVGITDGSMNGALTGEAGKVTLEAYSANTEIARLSMLPNGGTRGEIFYGYYPFTVKWRGLIPYFPYSKIYVTPSSGQCSYDAAPGGTFNSFKEVENGLAEQKFLGIRLVETHLHESHHCFIYTKSALAYIGDEYYCEDISNIDLAPINGTGKTPFDNYWGGNENLRHIEINHSLYNWLIKEIDTYIKGDRELNLCGEYQYTISNYQQGTNVQWTCSNNLQIVSAPNSPTLIIRAIDQGNGWIRANVSSLDHRKDLGYYTVIVNEGNVIAATETTENTTWNTSLNIWKDFTVKSGHTLTIQNTTISIAPNIKIKIEPNAKLIVDNSTLKNYCNSNYWGGIEVYGNKNQRQLEQFQGYLELKNNSIIENARNAVSLWKSDDWNSMGGIVNATNTTFKNNIRSVEFISYKNKNQNNEEIDNVSKFTNCNFVWDNNMYANDKESLNHITLWDVKGVKFIACDFRSSLAKDDNILKHGIYAVDAGLKVQGILIPNATGFTIDRSEFINLNYGLRIENSSKTFSIQDSYFEDNLCGVFVTSVNNSIITNNEFKIYPIFNPRGLYPSDVSFGAVINNSTGYKIEQNIFNGNGEFTYSVGLQIKNSGSGLNVVRNNVFSDLLYSTVAIGKNRGINNNGEYIGVKYNCNDFRGSQYGIFIYKDKDAPTEWYGIDLNQDGGDLSKSAENIFDQKSSSDIYIYDNLNTYNYSCPIGTVKEPILISSNIKKIPASLVADCSRNYGFYSDIELYNNYVSLENDYFSLLYTYNNLLDGGSKDILLDKLQDSWGGDVWDLRADYLAESPYLSPDVLKELAISEKLPLPVYLEVALSNPEGTQKDEFVKFMNSDDGINLLTTTGIELITDSWNTKTFRSTVESNISSKLGDIEEVVRNQIQREINDSTGFNISNYRSLLDNIRNIDAKYELVDSYIGTKEYSNARGLLNSLLIDPEILKYNEIDINDYLSLIDIMEGRDSTNQMSINEQLINLSQSTTRAGSKARAYLNFYDSKTNYNPDYVVIDNKKSARIKINRPLNAFEADVTALPNPAKDYIAISYNLKPQTTEYIIKIYDNKGSIVYSGSLKGNKGIQNIDIRKFTSGTYVYNVENGNEKCKSGKFIVVR